MQGGHEDEYRPEVRTALALAGTVFSLLEHLLVIAMWSLGAAAVIDLTKYLRGY